jgi:hypothetical protein
LNGFEKHNTFNDSIKPRTQDWWVYNTIINRPFSFTVYWKPNATISTILTFNSDESKRYSGRDMNWFALD